jgi:hypothetical protein
MKELEGVYTIRAYQYIVQILISTQRAGRFSSLEGFSYYKSPAASFMSLD